MPSAIWSGTLGFGLVSVPVRLVAAARSRDVRFNQLDAETHSRIRYRRVAESTGEEVPSERIVKGYEITPGRYVVVDDDDLGALAPKASRTIEILEFVDLDRIDPVYFEQPYYVVPEETAARPYRLLVDAMGELGKVAIGRLVLRGKEHLVAIRPRDGVLCLETMRYADEVLPLPDVAPADDAIAPSEREIEIARQLVSALAGDFEPDRYHDEYREQLLELIERKAAGEVIEPQPIAEEPGRVVDLMAALEASLARARARTGGEGEGGEAGGEADGEGGDEAAEAATPRRSRARRGDGAGAPTRDARPASKTAKKAKSPSRPRKTA